MEDWLSINADYLYGYIDVQHKWKFIDRERDVEREKKPKKKTKKQKKETTKSNNLSSDPN